MKISNITFTSGWMKNPDTYDFTAKTLSYNFFVCFFYTLLYTWNNYQVYMCSHTTQVSSLLIGDRGSDVRSSSCISWVANLNPCCLSLLLCPWAIHFTGLSMVVVVREAGFSRSCCVISPSILEMIFSAYSTSVLTILLPLCDDGSSDLSPLLH